jgi:hypothetical protein
LCVIQSDGSMKCDAYATNLKSLYLICNRLQICMANPTRIHHHTIVERDSRVVGAAPTNRHRPPRDNEESKLALRMPRDSDRATRQLEPCGGGYQSHRACPRGHTLFMQYAHLASPGQAIDFEQNCGTSGTRGYIPAPSFNSEQVTSVFELTQLPYQRARNAR